MPRVPFDPATDYYRLLGVESGAPPEAIQAAYRRLAKAYHPDLNAGSSQAAEQMAKLNVAKSVLLDRETRAIYDQLRGPRRLYAEPLTSSRRAATATAQPEEHVTVRYAPIPSSARARHRVVSHAGTRAQRKAGFDRGTGILLLIAVPLIAALSMYVFQAVQLSIEPLKAPPQDVTLVPGQSYRPTTRGAADGVYSMLADQPLSRDLAARANNFILARSDSTPESEELRTDGRRLVRSASQGDTQAWAATVNHICQLAGRC